MDSLRHMIIADPLTFENLTAEPDPEFAKLEREKMQTQRDKPLEVVEGCTFDAADAVVLDGKSFIDCTFNGCEIFYGGGDLTYERCDFSNCRMTFIEAAHRTLAVMQGFGYTIIAPSGEKPKANARGLYGKIKEKIRRALGQIAMLQKFDYYLSLYANKKYRG